MSRSLAPPSPRPQAQLHHLRDMGAVVIAGDRAIVAHRMGGRTEWRRQLGSEWFERIDAGAPVMLEGTRTVSDCRETPGASPAPQMFEMESAVQTAAMSAATTAEAYARKRERCRSDPNCKCGYCEDERISF